MNSKMWLGGAALALMLLAGCGGGGSSNNSAPAMASSSSSAPTVSSADAFTQSVQGILLANTLETNAPNDITGIVPVLNETASPVAVY